MVCGGSRKHQQGGRPAAEEVPHSDPREHRRAARGPETAPRCHPVDIDPLDVTSNGDAAAAARAWATAEQIRANSAPSSGHPAGAGDLHGPPADRPVASLPWPRWDDHRDFRDLPHDTDVTGRSVEAFLAGIVAVRPILWRTLKCPCP